MVGSAAQSVNIIYHCPVLSRPSTYAFFTVQVLNVENADRSIKDLGKARLYMAAPKSFDDVYDVLPQYDESECERYLREDITPERMESVRQYLGRLNPRISGHPEWNAQEIERSYGGFEGAKEEFFKSAVKNIPRMIERLRANLRCACLAEEHDSTMMWGLYASKHKGFVAQ